MSTFPVATLVAQQRGNYARYIITLILNDLLLSQNDMYPSVSQPLHLPGYKSLSPSHVNFPIQELFVTLELSWPLQSVLSLLSSADLRRI